MESFISLLMSILTATSLIVAIVVIVVFGLALIYHIIESFKTALKEIKENK